MAVFVHRTLALALVVAGLVVCLRAAVFLPLVLTTLVLVRVEHLYQALESEQVTAAATLQ